jgi:hypothetical protein
MDSSGCSGRSVQREERHESVEDAAAMLTRPNELPVHKKSYAPPKQHKNYAALPPD